jgi:uncharacterized membrane protein YeiH
VEFLLAALPATADAPIVDLLGSERLLLAVDLVGVFVFGLSGALVAVRRELDLFGVAVLAVATGLGGGMIRDVLIGAVPPVALADARYLIAALAAAGVGFVSHRLLERLGPAVRLLDALGLGFFAVAGTSKALSAGLPGFTAVGLGVLTAVGGGVVRDLLANEVPLVLHREIYAVAALVGAVIVTIAATLDAYEPLTAAIAIIVTFAIRLVAIRRQWNAPRPKPVPE